MAAGTQVSLQEYLATTYRPDCDYIDGELIERNMGEQIHAWVQAKLVSWLMLRVQELNIRPLTECRLQITPTRFRIPDLMVLTADAPWDPIVRQAPLLCIEILSKDDTMRAIMRRIQDYLQIGVPTCWILEPSDRLAWVADEDGVHQVKDGVLRAAHFVLPLTDIWPA